MTVSAWRDQGFPLVGRLAEFTQYRLDEISVVPVAAFARLPDPGTMCSISTPRNSVNS